MWGHLKFNSFPDQSIHVTCFGGQKLSVMWFNDVILVNFTNTHADNDPVLTSSITEIWKLTVKVEEAFNISIRSFHEVLHNPQLYV
jgi:hypothetical protein